MRILICRYYIFEHLSFVSIFYKSDHFNKTQELNDLKFCLSVVNRLTDIENEKEYEK